MSDQYPRNPPPTPPDRVYDDDVLSHNATNAAERAQVFNHAVNNDWAGDDIGKIERFEPSGPNARYFLAKWPYLSANN